MMEHYIFIFKKCYTLHQALQKKVKIDNALSVRVHRKNNKKGIPSSIIELTHRKSSSTES
jgi:hypothetical protein